MGASSDGVDVSIAGGRELDGPSTVPAGERDTCLWRGDEAIASAAGGKMGDAPPDCEDFPPRLPLGSDRLPGARRYGGCGDSAVEGKMLGP